MKERKQIVALICIVVFLGWTLFYLLGWGVRLDDPEFDLALKWAEETGITTTEYIAAYPFQSVSRAQAAHWYVLLAQDIGLVPSVPLESCVFDDIAHLDRLQQDIVRLSCSYGFFRGTGGSFHPDLQVTKANSLVALMRGLFPAREFEEEDMYWLPYTDLAYELGITRRPSSPYMTYLITQYELLLQLWRTYHMKN